MNSSYNLDRFLKAQESTYQLALSEIQQGKKQSHWMWFIFPQIAGLGFTDYNIFYAIKDVKEAMAYLQHPILGQRLIEISKEVLSIKNKTALEIMGKPDTRKLKSCMTLFSILPNTHPVFKTVLEKLYLGEVDTRTIEIIISQNDH